MGTKNNLINMFLHIKRHYHLNKFKLWMVIDGVSFVVGSYDTLEEAQIIEHIIPLWMKNPFQQKLPLEIERRIRHAM